MKNLVGQTPRGDNFFPRTVLIEKVYRRLDAGNHVFLSAPRRVGKTSIMRHLEDNPRENYLFLYIITESVDSAEGYYRKLLEELLRSDVVRKLAKGSQTAKEFFDRILEKINKISLSVLEVEFTDQQKPLYSQEFEELLSKIETGNQRLIIMVDEFPQTVENIRHQKGDAAALNFLRLNREQRQSADDRIQFMYTGSIGLPSLVKSLGSLQVINDLNVVEITPLSEVEAAEMAHRILLHYHVPITQAAIPHLLSKIDWLIPFHIQLAVQEIIDMYETTGEPVHPQLIDMAFARISNSRNDVYFDSYFSRLKRVFEGDEYAFVIELLNSLSIENTLKAEQIEQLAGRKEIRNIRHILESLQYDGYINNLDNPREYRFTSSILKIWWGKYVV
ncbi:MAG: ATP-binding protein [Bacteroidota bacterium]